MVGDDREPGQPAAGEHDRRERDRAQPGHGDLGEPAAGLEPAGHGAAAVDHPCPAGEGPHRDPQRVAVRGEAVRELVGALVEREGHRGVLQDQDLTAAELEAVTRPACVPAVDLVAGDRHAELAQPVAGTGAGTAGGTCRPARRSAGGRLRPSRRCSRGACPRRRGRPRARRRRSCRRARSGRRPRRRDPATAMSPRRSPAPASSPASPCTRISPPRMPARDPAYAPPRRRPAEPPHDEPPAAHLRARPVARVALDDELAVAHPRADVRAGDRRRPSGGRRSSRPRGPRRDPGRRRRGRRPRRRPRRRTARPAARGGCRAGARAARSRGGSGRQAGRGAAPRRGPSPPAPRAGSG